MTQKELMIQKLRERGCRITRQRLVLLDVILEGESCCCREIYDKAAKRDGRIGMATVYRMLNTLEESGVISRESRYKIICGQENCAS